MYIVGIEGHGFTYRGFSRKLAFEYARLAYEQARGFYVFKRMNGRVREIAEVKPN